MKKRKLRAIAERRGSLLEDVAGVLVDASFRHPGKSRTRNDRHSRMQQAHIDLLVATTKLSEAEEQIEKIAKGLGGAIPSSRGRGDGQTIMMPEYAADVAAFASSLRERLRIAEKDLTAHNVELASLRADLEKSTAHGFAQEQEIACGEQLVQKLCGHLLRIAAGLHVDTTGSIDEVADACALQARLLDVDRAGVFEWLTAQAKAEWEQDPHSARAPRMSLLLTEFLNLWPYEMRTEPTRTAFARDS